MILGTVINSGASVISSDNGDGAESESPNYRLHHKSTKTRRYTKNSDSLMRVTPDVCLTRRLEHYQNTLWSFVPLRLGGEIAFGFIPRLIAPGYFGNSPGSSKRCRVVQYRVP